eukprot:scaffold110713_cov63-Phaeocystis_antarctica.AAC.2
MARSRVQVGLLSPLRELPDQPFAHRIVYPCLPLNSTTYGAAPLPDRTYVCFITSSSRAGAAPHGTSELVAQPRRPRGRRLVRRARERPQRELAPAAQPLGAGAGPARHASGLLTHSRAAL